MTDKSAAGKKTGVASTAVMFSDVSGSTALYRDLGDERAEHLVRLAVTRLQEICAASGGQVIKTIGDELMSRYPSGAQAAQAAIEMQQQALKPLDESGKRLRLRIGFASGPAVERGGDLFGDVVNIAARMTAMAKADQILTTEGTAAEFDRELRACTRLFDKTPVKGIKEEISVVQVLWDRRNQTSIIAVSPSATAMAMKLHLVYGGREFQFTPGDLPKRLGRADDCDVVVPSECASRHHARLEYNRGKFMLVDESSNGTYVEVPEGGGKRNRIVYLRNESFAMVGAGRFSLGTRPESDPHALSFKTS